MFDLPVTIVSGYLGSGKTTYINTLLQTNNGVRYAVLVNDFGELNIDVSLIESSSAKSISLANGCVCCSIANDLDSALAGITSIEQTIDWVLLEASGVADSQRIENTVLNWPGFTLKQTLTMVDVTRIKSLAADKYVGAHIDKQLRQAQKIVLTKTDLINSKEQAEIEHWLSVKNNISTIDNKTDFHPDFVSYSFRHEYAISRLSLEEWLSELHDNTLRVKGFVFLQEDPDFQYLLQWVWVQLADQNLSMKNNDRQEKPSQPAEKNIGRLGTELRWSLEKYRSWESAPETQLVLISKQSTDSPFSGILDFTK
jgi:G3E family GTPase